MKQKVKVNLNSSRLPQLIPDERRLAKLFNETPDGKTAIKFIQITKKKVTIKLNRYYIRPCELKKMWLKYRYRLHSYNIDPYNSQSLLEFKRCV